MPGGAISGNDPRNVGSEGSKVGVAQHENHTRTGENGAGTDFVTPRVTDRNYWQQAIGRVLEHSTPSTPDAVTL
jgi:hypothetical protein